MNENRTLEQKAREFAEKAHEGQFRKDGKTGYFRHLVGVVSLLSGDAKVRDEDILAAGWLHDVIEDCNVSREVLEKEFNPEVSRIVSALTRDVDRETYKERIRNSDYAVQIVKLADTVHNCSEMTHPNIPRETIERKLEDCKVLYFDLAKKICPEFYRLLRKHTESHYSGQIWPAYL